MADGSSARVCSIEGCGKPHKAYGRCVMHHTRWKKWGTDDPAAYIAGSEDPTEQWRPVVGFEGAYEVSDRGRVRTIARSVPSPQGSRFVTSRLLRVWVREGSFDPGRSTVHLAGKTFFLHRVVLEAFVGPCPPGMEGCHDNGDPADNRVANLRWDTHHENMLDVLRYGQHWQSARDLCKYGHPLAEWNRTPSALRRGHRACNACGRARSILHNGHLRGEMLDHQAVSDRCLQDLARENGVVL